MLAPLVPHLGAGHQRGRVLWIHIGPINGQPVELAKLALCIFFASYFAEKRELLSVPTFRLGNRLVLDPRPLGPDPGGLGLRHARARRRGRHRLRPAHLRALHRHAVAGAGAVALCRGRVSSSSPSVPWWPAISSPRSTTRAELAPSWQSTRSTPWERSISCTGPLRPGHAAASPAPASASACSAASIPIPEVNSDYIFAAFGTEMGLLGTTVIVFAFTLIVGAGMRIAQTARSEFAKLVAAGLTVIIGMQAFFIMAGIVRLLPLTGITLPFMAYGGSSLVANYVLIALLMRISDEGERAIVASQATATPLGRGPRDHRPGLTTTAPVGGRLDPRPVRSTWRSGQLPSSLPSPVPVGGTRSCGLDVIGSGRLMAASSGSTAGLPTVARLRRGRTPSRPPEPGWAAAGAGPGPGVRRPARRSPGAPRPRRCRARRRTLRPAGR